MRVYVAGPLGGNSGLDFINNVKVMLDVAQKIIDKGHSPYVPCLDFLLGIRTQKTWLYEDFYAFNFPWIEVCDALYFIGSSRGADMELEHAKKLGKKVYFSINDVPIIWKPFDKTICGKCRKEFKKDGFGLCPKCRKEISEKVLSMSPEQCHKVKMIKSAGWFSRLIRKFEHRKNCRKEEKDNEILLNKAGARE